MESCDGTCACGREMSWGIGGGQRVGTAGRAKVDCHVAPLRGFVTLFAQWTFQRWVL